jgi:hypothetical protein
LVRLGTSLRLTVSGVLLATGASILLAARRDKAGPVLRSQIPGPYR